MSRWGASLVLSVGWAVAEATIWPIMPDAVMVPLALRRPASWWQLVLGAMLGTVLGGAISYLVGRRQPVPASIEWLPLVRPAMVTAASRWLEREGPRGVWRQPATGVPFKVFARLAGAQRVSLLPFLAWAMLARGVRILLLTGLAALVGWGYQPLVGRWYWLLTGLWVVAFGAALRRTVQFWERRP